MAFTEALRPKPGSKHLSVIINAEGKEIQVGIKLRITILHLERI